MKVGLLPLPLGEGWGEGFVMFSYSWCFPHPSLLPEGEGTRRVDFRKVFVKVFLFMTQFLFDEAFMLKRGVYLHF